MGSLHLADGIVLNRILHQEKHCILSVLTREGEKLSILAYGGASTGVKRTSLELGHCYQFELSRVRKKTLLSCRSWSSIWQPQKIRAQYKLYYAACFYLEVLRKILPDMQEGDEMDESADPSWFAILSNALFALDSQKSSLERLPDHLLFFLVKCLHAMGLLPQVERSSYGDERPGEKLSLDFAAGQFVKVERGGGHGEDAYLLQHILDIQQTSFKSMRLTQGAHWSEVDKMISYLAYHTQIDPKSIRSAQLLFQ